MENNQQNEQKFNNLLLTVKEYKSLWLLQAANGMFAMTSDNEDRLYLPVWANEADARLFIKNEWGNYRPEKMDFAEFITWLNELNQDNILISAFPDTENRAFAISPIDFIDLLKK